MRSVQKVSIHIIWKIETFIKEDTRNIVHKTVMPQAPFKGDFSLGERQKSQGAKSGL